MSPINTKLAVEVLHIFFVAVKSSINHYIFRVGLQL